MRVAVYGGSFNPPHVGHLLVASWVLWTHQADAVWLLPTFAHPFAKDMAPFPERMEMCRKVATLHPGLRACDVEARLPVPSYSIDTLRALDEENPDLEFRFVLGADLVAELDRWKEWSAIEKDFSPILVDRQGYPPVGDSPTFPGVSSTRIRQDARRGRPIDSLVPHIIRDDVVRIYKGLTGPDPAPEP